MKLKDVVVGFFEVGGGSFANRDGNDDSPTVGNEEELRSHD